MSRLRLEEVFAKPCVGAIIEKQIDGETNGMLEIPAGKIREYENILMKSINEYTLIADLYFARPAMIEKSRILRRFPWN